MNTPTTQEREPEDDAARLRELEVLHGLSEVAARARELREVQEAALDAVLEGTRADRASLHLFDRSGTMRFVAWRGLSEACRRAVDGHSPWRPDEWDAEIAAVEDVASDPSVASFRMALAGEGVRALCFVPIALERRLLGKFTLYYEGAHPFAPEELRLARTVANHVAFVIDRSRREEEVRRSEERLRLALEGARMGTWERDLATDRMTFDARELELFGFGPGEDPAVEEVLSRIHVDDVEAAERATRAALAGGVADVEFRVVPPGGPVLWLAGRWTAVRDAAGRPERFLGVTFDVTARREAEEARRATEERYRILFERAPVGIARGDVETRTFVEVNPTLCQMLRRSPEELVGLPIEEITHPGDRARTREVVRRLLEGEIDRHVYEKRLLRADGEAVWTLVHVFVAREAGRPPFLYATIADVSSRKAAEDALLESEERFRRAVLNAPIPILIHAEDGKVVEVNDALLSAIGWAREEIARIEDWASRAHREQASEMLERIERAFREGRGDRFEAVVHPRRGRPREWLVTTSAPERMTDGRRFLVTMALDVTERKREEELLRDIDRRKDEFLAILGHELRNPLAALDAGVRVLSEGARSEEDERWVRSMMGEQVRQLASLVDDLLDLTRVSRGKIELRPRRMAVADAVGRAVEAARPRIEERGQSLVVSVEPPDLSLVGDPTRVEQMIVNLLTNASKYSGTGVRIRAEARGERGEVRVSVADEGIGLAPEELTRIFEPFAQVRAERGGGGLGIGLTLVRQLATLHGGRVEATSPGPGRGSTFTVSLPAGGPQPGTVVAPSRDPAPPGTP